MRRPQCSPGSIDIDLVHLEYPLWTNHVDLEAPRGGDTGVGEQAEKLLTATDLDARGRGEPVFWSWELPRNDLHLPCIAKSDEQAAARGLRAGFDGRESAADPREAERHRWRGEHALDKVHPHLLRACTVRGPAKVIETSSASKLTPEPSTTVQPERMDSSEGEGEAVEDLVEWSNTTVFPGLAHRRLQVCRGDDVRGGGCGRPHASKEAHAGEDDHGASHAPRSCLSCSWTRVFWDAPSSCLLARKVHDTDAHMTHQDEVGV